MPATSQRRDPLPVYCFRVEIDGIDGTAAFFRKVSGLRSETEVVDILEGGQNSFMHRLVGATKWANLIFERGFSQNDALLQWREEWLFGSRRRRNGKIIQLDTKLNPVCTWSFRDGWPCRWELSEFDASKSALTMEVLEIAHHGLLHEALSRKAKAPDGQARIPNTMTTSRVQSFGHQVNFAAGGKGGSVKANGRNSEPVNTSEVTAAEAQAPEANTAEVGPYKPADERLVENKFTATKGLNRAAKQIRIPSSKYPETAAHIRDAQAAGKPSTLTIDRAGTAKRRREALAGHQKVPGEQLDEYPPAMFQEGGRGASVRLVSPHDNMGAGACIGNQCRGLPEGTQVRIIVD